MPPAGWAHRLTVVGAAVSTVSAVVALVNLRSIPRLNARRTRHDRQSGDATRTEPVTVCIPARNEAARLPLVVGDLARQRDCPDLRVLVLDDDSSDGTAAAAESVVGQDPRFRIVTTHMDPPDGWTGKAAACVELARLADLDSRRPGVLVFLDADVRLTPDAIAAAVAALRRHGAALLCPWPTQEAHGLAERLVQPLLAWSWMSTLPVTLANASTTPSTAVACGQFMVFDADAYRAAGGHVKVASSLAEDLDIARLLRGRGDRTVVVSGAGSVRCRMYGSAAELRGGYTRWLWQAFGGRGVVGQIGALAVAGAATVIYLLPPAAALLGSGATRRWGAAGWLAASVSRAAAHRLEMPDAPLAAMATSACGHPLSIGAFLILLLDSSVRARRGRLGWKDRSLRQA